jgi:hypothetical protein
VKYGVTVDFNVILAVYGRRIPHGPGKPGVYGTVAQSSRSRTVMMDSQNAYLVSYLSPLGAPKPLTSVKKYENPSGPNFQSEKSTFGRNLYPW